MFTLENMRTLLSSRPFVPFRLHMSGGGTVDVRSPEQVLILRHYAYIGMLDPNAADSIYDRATLV
jgi:hypothetical protein